MTATAIPGPMIHDIEEVGLKQQDHEPFNSVGAPMPQGGLDPDKEAWSIAVDVLLRDGMSQKSARRFFGSTLARNKLTARAMLPALRTALANGTLDPVPYLTRAAQNIANGRVDPAAKVDWT